MPVKGYESLTYPPRDARRGIATRASRATRTALAGGAVAAATATVVATAWVPAAFAAADPLQVQLGICGTGSSATWDASQLPVLTSGTATAGTCPILPGGTDPGVDTNPGKARAHIAHQDHAAVIPVISVKPIGR
jgi:hypothetical protein